MDQGTPAFINYTSGTTGWSRSVRLLRNGEQVTVGLATEQYPAQNQQPQK